MGPWAWFKQQALSDLHRGQLPLTLEYEPFLAAETV